MTRKHFEAIALTISKLDVEPTVRDAIARQLAVTLASTNPRFDLTRFLCACGV